LEQWVRKEIVNYRARFIIQHQREELGTGHDPPLLLFRVPQNDNPGLGPVSVGSSGYRVTDTNGRCTVTAAANLALLPLGFKVSWWVCFSHGARQVDHSATVGDLGTRACFLNFG
jgi:hypothetical protein